MHYIHQLNVIKTLLLIRKKILDNSDIFATRFGLGDRTPILSRVILPSTNATDANLISRSLINIDPPNLLLVNTAPSMDGKGIILHLRELEGKQAKLNTKRIMEETRASSIEEVNVLEELLEPISSSLILEKFETKFIKLNFEHD